VSNNYSVLCWNINGRIGNRKGYRVPHELILKEVLKESSEHIENYTPDFIVLTEFVCVEGSSELIALLKGKEYEVYLSEEKNGENGILIAIKKSLIDVESVKTCEIGSLIYDDRPNFLQVNANLVTSGKQLQLIGIRIRTREKDDILKERQLDNWKNHLKGLSKDSITLCVGDFNAWGSYLGNNNKIQEGFEIYSPGLYTKIYTENKKYINTFDKNQLVHWSYVFENYKSKEITIKAPLDHLVVSNNCKCIEVQYKWSFLCIDNGYGDLKKDMYLGNVSLPDHAILIAEIEFY